MLRTLRSSARFESSPIELVFFDLRAADAWLVSRRLTVVWFGGRHRGAKHVKVTRTAEAVCFDPQTAFRLESE